MRYLLFCSVLAIVFFSCKQKDKKQPAKKVEKTGYIISKDGIGELKIGMSQSEVENLLSQKFTFKHAKETTGSWADTVTSKYKDLDVTLFFERQYSDNDAFIMELIGLQTNSPLCKTADGLGIGDEKPAIITAYDDNPINMGPEYERVNDTTWLPSKTKYNINVRDDKYEKELVFHLLNKKVVSLEASMIMGD